MARKIWISTAQVADKMLILTRTTPVDEVRKPTEGLSLFYTALDRRHVEVRVIDKMGRKAVDSNQVFIDALEVPLDDRIGEEGRGFEYILHGMNPGAHPDRRRSDRARPRRAAAGERLTQRSASCSAGRSGKTRPSSIRSPNAGWSWKPPS